MSLRETLNKTLSQSDKATHTESRRISLLFFLCYSLRGKCPYSELFYSTFSRIRTEYGEIQSISSYSALMRENADQKTPNTDTFCAVIVSKSLVCFRQTSSSTRSKINFFLFLYNGELPRKLPVFENFTA